MSSRSSIGDRKPLRKVQSWSPDASREETWLRRKRTHATRRAEGACSFSEDDIDELKACIELGFGFHSSSPVLSPNLSRALPALDFYCTVNKQYINRLPRTSSGSSVLAVYNEDGSESTMSSNDMLELGDDPETVKTRLKQWAQAVACSLMQFSGEPY